MQILFRPLNDDPRIVACEPDWPSLEDHPIDVEGARLRYRDMLSRWASLFGIATDELSPVADTEDWTENAVRLLAAVDTGVPVHVVHRGQKHEDFSIGPSLADGSPWDPSAQTIFCGSLIQYDPLFPRPWQNATGVRPVIAWPTGGFEGKGGDYWRDPTLRKALGRRLAVSGGNPGGEGGYVRAVRDLVEAGAERILAKIVFQSKYEAPKEVILPRTESGGPDVGDDAVWKAFYRAFDVHLMDCDGRAECFLLQELRPMVAEYRIVVVGGRPVAGAGCVEWLCPIFHDSTKGPFDPLVEGRRNDGELSSRPDLVARYVAKAEELCASHAVSGIDRFDECTMDFALDDETDEILLVETNQLQNFGLYAMEFGPVIEAAVEIVRGIDPAGNPAP
jgi:hypothetical protein